MTLKLIIIKEFLWLYCNIYLFESTLCSNHVLDPYYFAKHAIQSLPADTPENNKTLFGEKQLEWLKQGLSNSNSTWKIISNDVPISIPTGSNASILGRDAWADGNETDFSAYTGFERELTDLLTFVDNGNIDNIVFITTDVHFPAFIKYEKDLNGDGDNVTFHELVSGAIECSQRRITISRA